MLQGFQSSNQPSKRRSPSPASRRQSQELCWYHAKFGDKAQKCKSPCKNSGEKLPGHSLMATGAAGLTHSRLFYITDSVSNYRFLIDTGAEVSVLPPSSTERQQRCNDFSLVAVNGAIYGKRSLTLNLGLRRVFRWVFVIANEQIPIIGADFLHHHSLLVYMANSRLVDTSGVTKPGPGPGHQY